jgi:hypothetical protein
MNSVEGIKGATPDTYGWLRNIHHNDFSLDTKTISGASPPPHKDFLNKPNYNLYTKDATG